MLKINWYGFKHTEVNKMFDGELTYLNDICVNDEYQPVAVYRVKKPNYKKGHKKFLLLQVLPNNSGCVRGMSPKEMKKWRYQSGIRCVSCQDIIYSVMRHDFKHCKCGKVNINGGKNYTKIGFETGSDFENITIDLLTDKITNYDL